MSALMFVLLLALVVVMIAATWKVYEKADEAGWKCLVPFYNSYILFRIAGRNGWGFLLLLVPIVNIVVSIILAVDLAKHFGKSPAYGIFLLWLISFIGILDLGFGDAKYVGQKHA